MGNPTSIQRYGDQLAVFMDDGTKQLAYATTGDFWRITGGSSTPPTDPGGGGPGGGVTAVIFPCAEHRVSDTFQDHIARGSVNPGTDYIAAYGSDFWSVADGTVTDIDTSNDGSGGRMIHVDHNDGTGIDYLHLSEIGVSVGQVVKQGDPMGKTGASGFNSDHGYGAHLHVSYRTVTGHAYTNFHSVDFDALVRSLGLT
jgi:murein DD-endopeptidase MepM/ murein hydrolase activator NlpD